MAQKIPWTKRWPGEWSMKATFQTPGGSRLELEMPVPAELAENFLEALFNEKDLGKENDEGSSNR